MNAKTVNNLHLAFLVAYLGASLTLAESVAAWPARRGTPRFADADVAQALLARKLLVIWIGLPSAVLVLHVVTRVAQQVSLKRWLLSRREQDVLELLSPSQSAPILEDRRRLFAWIGVFATSTMVATSVLFYGLGTWAVTRDARALHTITLVVWSLLAISLGTFALGARYGLRARKRIQAARSS